MSLNRATITKTGTGTSPTHYVGGGGKAPTVIGLGLIISGTVECTVQHTFEDPASGSATWFDHPFLADITASTDGNYSYPVAGVRISVASGDGTATLVLLSD